MDIGELFLKCRVSEVQSTVNNRKRQVEEKKDELRSLVGERHRDIIEASDTIQLMKSLCAKFHKSLKNLSDNCSSHNELYDGSIVLGNATVAPQVTVAAYIKLLLDLPESIWNCMDFGHHSKSASYFFIARHVSAKLLFSSDVTEAHANPTVLIQRTCNSLLHMESILINACRQRLTSEMIDSKLVCDTLCALCLLEDYSLSELVEEFLGRRKAALRLLVMQPRMTGKNAFSLKDHFVLVGKYLVETLSYTTELFTPIISEISNAELHSPIFDHICELRRLKIRDIAYLSDDHFYDQLPKELLDLQILSMGHVNDPFLSPETVNAALNSWWKVTLPLCRQELCTLLSHATSLSNLMTIRERVLHIVKSYESSANRDVSSAVTDGCASASVPYLTQPIDVWNELFKDLFIQYIRILLDKTLDECFTEFTLEVHRLLTNLRCAQPVDSKVIPETHGPRLTLGNDLANWARFMWTDVQNGNGHLNASPSPFVDLLSVYQLESNTKSGVTSAETGTTSTGELLQLLQPAWNTGLVVFCCLVGCKPPTIKTSSITAYSSVPPGVGTGSTDQFPQPHAASMVTSAKTHLLVFLQRLLAVNCIGTGFGAGATEGAICVSTEGGTANSSAAKQVGRQRTQMRQLNPLPPCLESIVSQMNQKVVAAILTVASNADRDALAIWQVICAGILRLIERFRVWAISTANPGDLGKTDGTPTAPSSDLALEPEAGLLLSRACLAFLSCPALGATVITANGVMETENADTAKTPSFSWSNISHLRSVWSGASSTLRDLSDSLTLAALMKATTPVLKAFRDRLLTTFSLVSLTVYKTTSQGTGQKRDDDLSRIFLSRRYWADGPNLDVVLPFNEAVIKGDSSQSAGEVNSDVVAVLRTPSNITLALHETLLDLVDVVNRLTVYGLSSPVSTRDFCLSTCDQLLTIYAEVVHLLWPALDTGGEAAVDEQPIWLAPSASSVQQYAMQLMLDIRFLVRLLVWPLLSTVLAANTSSPHHLDVRHVSGQEEAIKRLQATSQTLLTRLEAGIDPFDWEMCAEGLTTTIVAECIRAARHLYAPLACSTVSSVVGSEKVPVGDTSLSPSATASIMPLLRPVSDSFTGSADSRRCHGNAPGLLFLPLPLSSYLVSRQGKRHHPQSSELTSSLKSAVGSQFTESGVSNINTSFQRQPVSITANSHNILQRG